VFRLVTHGGIDQNTKAFSTNKTCKVVSTVIFCAWLHRSRLATTFKLVVGSEVLVEASAPFHGMTLASQVRMHRENLKEGGGGVRSSVAPTRTLGRFTWRSRGRRRWYAMNIQQCLQVPLVFERPEGVQVDMRKPNVLLTTAQRATDCA